MYGSTGYLNCTVSDSSLVTHRWWEGTTVPDIATLLATDGVPNPAHPWASQVYCENTHNLVFPSTESNFAGFFLCTVGDTIRYYRYAALIVTG